MSDKNSLGKIQSPINQAIIIIGLLLAGNILIAFLKSAGMEIEQRFPWTLAATAVLFFAIFNALLSLMTDNMDRYWTRSILSYIGLAVGGALMAWAFSSLSINEAGTYRWIYIVLTFGYLMFLSIIATVRKIVEFAQREEWNQPRLRKKKKRR